MVLVQIKNKESQLITNSATFETLAEAEAWVVACEADKAFGQPAHYETDPTSGEETETLIPAEYDVLIIEDFVDQEAINAQASEYLKSTDWYVIRALDSGVPMPDDIKALRQAAREKVVAV